MGESFDEKCTEVRKEIKSLAAAVKALMTHHDPGVSGVSDNGEMKANIMLAYRHMEDAAMRIGKAVQAYDGGKSVYDK